MVVKPGMTISWAICDLGMLPLSGASLFIQARETKRNGKGSAWNGLLYGLGIIRMTL